MIYGVKRKIGTCCVRTRNNAIESINIINNYITHSGHCQEFFSGRSELILRGDENKP